MMTNDTVGTLNREMIQDLDITLIFPDPNNPRRNFEETELDRLADSIKDNRLLSMLTVTPSGDRYMLSRGERRWRALQKLGVKKVTCFVVDIDGQTLQDELALIDEHFQVNLRPMERAMSYQRIMKARGWSATQLATSFKVDPKKVGRDLSLLKLEPAVQVMVQEKKVSIQAAELLGKLKPRQQIEVAERAIREQLDVKAVRGVVMPMLKRRTASTRGGCVKEFHLGKKRSVVVKAAEKLSPAACLSELVHASDSALAEVFSERSAVPPKLSLATMSAVFEALSNASPNLQAEANTATSKVQGMLAILLFDLSRSDDPAVKREWNTLLNSLPKEFKLYMATLARK